MIQQAEVESSTSQASVIAWDDAAARNARKHPVTKLSILIPVYNEIRTLRRLLDLVLSVKLPCDRELVIVDDGSTDGSRDLLREYAKKYDCIHVIFHKKNGGKGKALRTAIKAMTGDWAIIQDADLEYDPHDYLAMLEPVRQGVADAVFGSRFLTGRYRKAMFFWHTLANKGLTLFSNIFNDLNLTDMETCYKLIRSDILKSLNLRANGFSIEPEITAKLARWGARIYEVPISYKGRSYAEGKKIGLKDAFSAVWGMFYYRFLDRDYTNHEGFMILQAVRRAKRFNRWLIDQFDEYLGDHVFEAGAGIGNLTELMLTKKRLTAVDYEQFYVDRLEEAYGHLSNFSITTADLTKMEDVTKAMDGQPFDSVLCINVLEHIEPDVLVLENFYKSLKPGGHAIILVPHNPALYSAVDESLGHFRRYTFEELSEKMEQAGFEVIETKGFNRVGGFGWWFSGQILKKKTLTAGQMTIFEMLMPIVKLAEKFPFASYNSVICIGKKPE